MTQSLRPPVRPDSETGRLECGGPTWEPPAIGARIRQLRERLGLTQEKLAARLGVAFPTVNRWENGHTQPSPLALKQIEALALEVDHLRDRGDATAPSGEAPR